MTAAKPLRVSLWLAIMGVLVGLWSIYPLGWLGLITTVGAPFIGVGLFVLHLRKWRRSAPNEQRLLGWGGALVMAGFLPQFALLPAVREGVLHPLACLLALASFSAAGYLGTMYVLRHHLRQWHIL